MSVTELETVKNQLREQNHRIESLESTVKETLPPLLEKFDHNTTEMHKLCISINDLVNQIGTQRKESEKINRRTDKIEEKLSSLRDEVIESRPLVKVVRSLGTKMLWFSFTIVGAAVSIIMLSKS